MLEKRRNTSVSGGKKDYQGFQGLDEIFDQDRVEIRDTRAGIGESIAQVIRNKGSGGEGTGARMVGGTRAGKDGKYKGKAWRRYSGREGRRYKDKEGRY